jgi:hypothetical protein
MSNKRTHTDQAPSAKTMRRRIQRRRKHWAITIGCFCMLAVFISLAMTTDVTTVWFFHASSEGQKQSADAEAGARTGTVMLQTDENRCEVLKFDNDSGRAVDRARRCDKNVTFDARGVPVPLGTVHRLDAISKSFLGNAH